MLAKRTMQQPFWACVKTSWVVCPKSCAMKSGASSTSSGSAIVWWHGCHGCPSFTWHIACTEALEIFNPLRFRKGLRLCDNAALVEVPWFGIWHHDGGSAMSLGASGFQSWCKTRLLRPKFLMQNASALHHDLLTSPKNLVIQWSGWCG